MRAIWASISNSAQNFARRTMVPVLWKILGNVLRHFRSNISTRRRSNALARNHITRNPNHRKFYTREEGGRQAQTTLSVNVRRHGEDKLVRQDRVGSANSARDLHQKGRRQPIFGCDTQTTTTNGQNCVDDAMLIIISTNFGQLLLNISK